MGIENIRTGKPDVAGLKKRLIQFIETERIIDNQIERLQNLVMKMQSPSSPKMSDMPRTPSPDFAKMAKQVAKKIEIENKIDRLTEHQEREKEWIQNVLDNIEAPRMSITEIANEKSVIEMRYIDGESWPNIARMLFGQEENYEERQDSYLRRTTKIHGRALRNMAFYISRESQKKAI